jgi:hypothetical protein
MIKGPPENPSSSMPEQTSEASHIAARERLKTEIGSPQRGMGAETPQRKELTPEMEIRLQAAVDEYLAVEEHTRRQLSEIHQSETVDEGSRSA